jgi:MFS superfamily sulfate permease-like transporter
LTDGFSYSLATELRDLHTAKQIFQKVIMLRLGRVAEIDASECCVHRQFHQACQSRGNRVILSELLPQPMATLIEWRNADVFGQQNICGNFEQAVARARVVANASGIESSNS